MLTGEKIRAVARELGHGHLLYTWLDHYEQGGPDALIPEQKREAGGLSLGRRACARRHSYITDASARSPGM